MNNGMLSISWTRLIVVWVCMAIAMTANGIFREAVIKRMLSATAADVLSAVLGIIIIGVITRIGFSVISATATTGSLLATSVILVLLTVAFECTIGILVDHKSWSDLAGNYAIWRGQLWPIVLGFLAVTPFLWGRWFNSP